MSSLSLFSLPYFLLGKSAATSAQNFTQILDIIQFLNGNSYLVGTDSAS